MLKGDPAKTLPRKRAAKIAYAICKDIPSEEKHILCVNNLLSSVFLLDLIKRKKGWKYLSTLGSFNTPKDIVAIREAFKQ